MWYYDYTFKYWSVYACCSFLSDIEWSYLITSADVVFIWSPCGKYSLFSFFILSFPYSVMKSNAIVLNFL